VSAAILFGKMLLAAAVIALLVECGPLVLSLSFLSSISLAIYSTYQAIKAGRVAYKEGASFKELVTTSLEAFFDEGVKKQYMEAIELTKKITLDTIEEIDQTRQLFMVFGCIIKDAFSG
jgi:hypothetical protein